MKFSDNHRVNPDAPSHRRTILIVLLLLLAAALASQPLASALGWRGVNVLGPVLDSPPHHSLPFQLGALGGLAFLALILYVTGLNPLASRRSRLNVFLIALAPSLFAAATVAAQEMAVTGPPSLLLQAGVPALLLGPPLLILLSEWFALAVARRMALMADAREWRHLGIRSSRASLRIKPDNPEMIRRIGLLLAAEDDYSQAIKYLEKLGPIEGSGDQQRLSAMERSYRVTGRIDQAAECLRELFRINPMARSLGNRLLDDYLTLGKHAEALHLLEAAQLRDSMTRLRMAQDLHFRLGHIDEAFQLVRRLVEYESQDRETAIRMDRNLLAAAPSRNDIRIHLGRLMLESENNDRREEGARQLEDAIGAQPELWELRRELITYYFETDQRPRTKPHLQALVEDGAPDSLVHLTYAQMLQQEDKLDEAESVLRQLVEIVPDDWQGYFRLARLHFQRERVEEAAEQLAAAERIAPGDAKPSLDHLRNDIAAFLRRRKIAGMRQELERDGIDVAKQIRLIDELIDTDRVDEAISQCEDLLHRHPEALVEVQRLIENGIHRATMSYRLCDYLADLYFHQNRHDDLLELYRRMSQKSMEPARVLVAGCERILSREPMHAATRQELAWARRSLNDWQGVTDALEPIVFSNGAVKPDAAVEDKALWVEAAYRQGRIDEAARLGLEIAPELASESGFMLLMIDILQDLKDFEGAYRIYQQAQAASPDDPRLQRLARRLDYNRKRQRMTELGARTSENPLTPTEHFEKAELHRDLDQPEEAIIHYQRASLDADLHLPALANMAVVLSDRGMLDIAAETLQPIELTREIDDRHPRLKELIYQVARTLEKHKKYDQALGFYKRIFRVDASFRDVVDKLQRLG